LSWPGQSLLLSDGRPDLRLHHSNGRQWAMQPQANHPVLGSKTLLQSIRFSVHACCMPLACES